MKPRLETSSTVRKGRVYKRVINENVLSSVKPSVKMKGKNTTIPQTSEAVKDESTEQVKRPRVESEHQIQVQQKCKECHLTLENSLPAEHLDKGTSSAENLIEQRKDGVSEGMNMKETEQQLNNAPEVTVTPIMLPREVKMSSFSSQPTSKGEGLKSSQMKLGKMERDASNSTAEAATDGAKNTPPIPSPYMKSKEELTVTDLRAIAKSRKLHKYHKLKKEQLRILLGLQ